MLICRGDGTLFIDVHNGEIEWATVCSPIESYYVEKGYKNVVTLTGALNLDIKEFEIPECHLCPNFKECSESIDEDSEIDNSYCSAIDEKSTSESIMAALSTLSNESREELLGCCYSGD